MPTLWRVVVDRLTYSVGVKGFRNLFIKAKGINGVIFYIAKYTKRTMIVSHTQVPYMLMRLRCISTARPRLPITPRSTKEVSEVVYFRIGHHARFLKPSQQLGVRPQFDEGTPPRRSEFQVLTALAPIDVG